MYFGEELQILSIASLDTANRNFGIMLDATENKTWPSEESSNREYQDVIRVDSNVVYPQGYMFIHTNDLHPLPVFQYVREMTLARGRILYEVHDPYTTRFLGYICPQQVYTEAISNRFGAAVDAWRNLPPEELRHRQSMYRRVLDRFPRIPLIAAKLVTDKVAHSVVPLTKESLDGSVLDHCCHYWTSFDFRLENQDIPPFEAFAAVKPRIRRMIQSWLPFDLSDGRLAEFWWDHQILDEKKGAKGEGVTADVFYTPSVTQWYGGAELPVNLCSEPHAWL